MKFLVFCIVVATAACFTQAATTTRHPHHTHGTGHVTHVHHTHGTHPTHEPGERENFVFSYVPKTHKFYIISHQSCYVATLTADEIVSVHTDAGIRALEVEYAENPRFKDGTISPFHIDIPYDDKTRYYDNLDGTSPQLKMRRIM